MLELIAAGAIFTAVYLISCWFHPYRVCKACEGSGRSLSTTFRGAWGDCRSCKGTGRKIRFGAYVLGRTGGA